MDQYLTPSRIICSNQSYKGKVRILVNDSSPNSSIIQGERNNDEFVVGGASGFGKL